mmetsp:Transcript_1479/g.1727  ORF Transcript_1479/g.1727 Transcript_1479/m.1727 type:complete len:104 (+) Transcript_1479:105-416(+)
MAKTPEEKLAAKDDDDNDSEAVGFSICYARKKVLDGLRERLKKGEEVTKEQVNALTSDENVDPEEIMVPIDIAGLEDHDIEDMDAVIEKLGAKGVAPYSESYY